MQVYEAATIWVREAESTAAARRRSHKESAKGNCNHWGNPEDTYDEYFGSLGQIVFAAHAKQAGFEVESAPLYVPNDQIHTLPSWDARIQRVPIEIKSIPPDNIEDGREIRRRYMMVKKSEMHDSKLFVAVRFETHFTYWFPGFATDIEVRKAREFAKYKAAYAVPLDSLHPITKLSKGLADVSL